MELEIWWCMLCVGAPGAAVLVCDVCGMGQTSLSNGCLEID
jgi:hypothetical protein